MHLVQNHVCSKRRSTPVRKLIPLSTNPVATMCVLLGSFTDGEPQFGQEIVSCTLVRDASDFELLIVYLVGSLICASCTCVVVLMLRL